NGRRFELIAGQLVERPDMGAKSNRVATILIRMVDGHAATHKLGLGFSQECSYQIFADDPRRVRKPDGSFIRTGRLPGDKPPDGHVQIAPDLIFEVVSPNDLAEDINNRIVDYLRAGVRLIWVLYPATGFVHVFRQDGSASYLTRADQLSGEDVLPNFT